MQEIHEEINKRLAENTISPSTNNKMSRITDFQGRIYSHHQGWQRVSGETSGHIFSENEIPNVLMY